MIDIEKLRYLEESLRTFKEMIALQINNYISLKKITLDMLKQMAIKENRKDLSDKIGQLILELESLTISGEKKSQQNSTTTSTI